MATSRHWGLCYSYSRLSQMTTMLSNTADRLKDVLERPEDDINLAEAALLMAADEYPSLDVSTYLQRLDELAAGVRGRLPADATFEEQGFTGNTDDYYDPRNSFLNEVLDRKLGIPITLSILYIEIGRRIGLTFQGISFPGHFLVKSETDVGDIVLDPFSGGVALSEKDLVQRLRERFGEENAPPAPLAPLLRAAGKKEILLRML